ncbi:PAS domain S-box protein [Candidatus Poribacteria bacterium]|nr:PAS domain S-box protein [Candidatus Poribacteria bacterium]
MNYEKMTKAELIKALKSHQSTGVAELRAANESLQHEIAERMRAEDQIRYQNALLKAQAEADIDGVLVVDRERRWISFNQRFLEMWRIPEELALKRSSPAVLEWAMEQLIAPERFVEKILYLYEHLDQESREEIALTGGRIFDRYSAPVKGEDSVYYGRVWQYRDVTEQKRMEEDLRRFATVVRDSNDAITVQGFDGNIMAWNRSAEKMYGWSEAEGLKMNVEKIHPDDKRAEALAFVEKIRQGETLISFETRRVTKDGRILDIWLTATALVMIRDDRLPLPQRSGESPSASKPKNRRNGISDSYSKRTRWPRSAFWSLVWRTRSTIPTTTSPSMENS